MADLERQLFDALKPYEAALEWLLTLPRQGPYQDATVDYEALSVQRNAPRWIRQLKKYGYLPKAA